MHTNTKPDNVSSADKARRTEESCCGHEKSSPADSSNPVKAAELAPDGAPAETKLEAAQGKARGCCCGS